MVPGTSYIFFYNVFETEAEAVAANQGAATYVSEGELNGQIERVVFAEGPIGFDYTCVDESGGPGSVSNTPDESGSENVSPSIGLVAALVSMALSFFI